MASTSKVAEEEQDRLRSLFHTYDVDNSGRIENNEFSAICQELQVPSEEAEGIFSRLDADGDGTVTLEEFLSGFTDQHQKEIKEEEEKNAVLVEEFSNNKEQIMTR